MRRKTKHWDKSKSVAFDSHLVFVASRTRVPRLDKKLRDNGYIPSAEIRIKEGKLGCLLCSGGMRDSSTGVIENALLWNMINGLYSTASGYQYPLDSGYYIVYEKRRVDNLQLRH